MGVSYAATASVGYIEDYMNKVEKASHIKGTKYIHVLAPCPTGWGVDTDRTVEVARDAVNCGLWYLAEYEGGEFSLSLKPKSFSSVEDYLKCQSRFRHLTDKDIEAVEASRDAKWLEIDKNYKRN